MPNPLVLPMMWGAGSKLYTYIVSELTEAVEYYFF